MPIAGQIKPVHLTDPAQDIWDAVGPLDNVNVLFQNLLVALYLRKAGQKTAGGIIMVEEAVKEDEYQGKIGLVLKVGARAFKDEGAVQFHGFSVKAGDWVCFRPSDGLKMEINKVKCRLISDVYIKMTVSHPDDIY